MKDEIITDNFFELFDELSASLVSFWKSQTIYAAVKLGLFDKIGSDGIKLQNLVDNFKIDKDGLQRLVRALCSLDLLKVQKEKIFITKKGEFLREDNEFSLSAAAIMWNEEHYHAWSNATLAIKNGSEVFSSIYGEPFFTWLEKNKDKAELYQKAISTYAKKDYFRIPKIHDFSKHKRILDVGGGSGFFLKYMLEEYPEIKVMLLDTEKSIEIAQQDILKIYDERCTFFTGNFFEKIPKVADAIFLFRILHDWNDELVVKILRKCYDALVQNQHLYIVELILPDDYNNPHGALLNLNMLTVTGGKERTRNDFKTLLEENGFQIDEFKQIDELNSLIISTRK